MGSNSSFPSPAGVVVSSAPSAVESLGFLVFFFLDKPLNSSVTSSTSLLSAFCEHCGSVRQCKTKKKKKKKKNLSTQKINHIPVDPFSSVGFSSIGFSSAGRVFVTSPFVSMMTDPSLNDTDLRCFCSLG